MNNLANELTEVAYITTDYVTGGYNSQLLLRAAAEIRRLKNINSKIKILVENNHMQLLEEINNLR